jgi:hypothetical protein
MTASIVGGLSDIPAPEFDYDPDEWHCCISSGRRKNKDKRG